MHGRGDDDYPRPRTYYWFPALLAVHDDDCDPFNNSHVDVSFLGVLAQSPVYVLRFPHGSVVKPALVQLSSTRLPPRGSRHHLGRILHQPCRVVYYSHDHDHMYINLINNRSVSSFTTCL